MYFQLASVAASAYRAFIQFSVLFLFDARLINYLIVSPLTLADHIANWL